MQHSEYLSRALDCPIGRFLWGERTYVMGILNVTPDSFSGDGVMDVQGAVATGKRLVEEGAHILDVGGQSTRPAYAAKIESTFSGSMAGPQEISVNEELNRIIPVIEVLAGEVDVPISVDTYKPDVARRALDAGATIINDVWGLKADPELATVASEYKVPLVLMHNQRHTKYKDLITEIRASLEASIELALCAGVSQERIVLDPGFGFGKTPLHNLKVLRCLQELKALKYPLLIGTSRKSTLGVMLHLPVGERIEGTAATVAIAIANGADIIRVHDVKEMARVARMTDAIVRVGDITGEK